MAERGRAPGRTQGYAGTWPPREAARAGGFAPSGFGEWSSLLDTLRAWVRAEAGAGRLLPWVPIAFGAGIAFYFGADHEPVAWVTAVAAIAFCAAAFLLRRQKIFPLAVLIAAVATGKTARVAHGVLARPMYSVQLSGFVETRDIRERTDRFVLRVAQMESPRGQIKLERVRLSVRKGTAPAVGSFVELKARLQPPLAPLRPGSYDFGRDTYFAGIGASGFVTGAIKTVEPPLAGGLSLRLRRLHAGLARCDRRANTQRPGWRPARHRHRSLDRPPRRDLHTCERCDVHFRARPRAVDFRIPHGGGRRRGVLRGPRAPGADPGADRRLSDQEMVGRRGAWRRRVLSLAVRRRGRDPAFVFHDGCGADRGDGRPPRRDIPHARGSGDDRAGACAGSAGASEFPDVVRSHARTGGAGADRHAPPVCLA